LCYCIYNEPKVRASKNKFKNIPKGVLTMTQIFIESRFFDNGTALVKYHTEKPSLAYITTGGFAPVERYKVDEYDCYVDEFDCFEDWLEDAGIKKGSIGSKLINELKAGGG